ncbi:MAG TPA: hypothetical protein VID47_12230 [Actinomycetota bacterium]
MLRRFLTIVLTAGVIATGGSLFKSTPAHASGICEFRWWKNNGGYSVTQVKRTIRCAVAHYPVPGGADKAMHIAWRESRYDPYAVNPNGQYKGIYQQGTEWWQSRYHTYGFPYLRDRILNARTNIIVSIRMVHRDGWGPWGG